MSQKARFAWLFIPLAIYLALIGIIFVERTGVTYKVREQSLKYLEPTAQPVKSTYTDPPVECLVLFDSSIPEERIVDTTMVDTLKRMRVPFDELDVNASGNFDFKKYKNVVVAMRNLDNLKQIHAMVDWVETGGHVMFATYPSTTENFSSIYRKIGIRSMGADKVSAIGVAFTSDLFPGAKGMRLEGTEDFLNNTALSVELDSDARVHITSADDFNIPLLWEKDYGKGRFVVINTNQFANRVDRGILGAAYSLLQDVFAYPVINSSVFFIDDFPAPIREGYNEVITKEFNQDIRGFLINNWWPDIQKLGDKYGLKYTGLLVETYNYKVAPPYGQDVAMDDHRYLGGMLLRTGGEIGLHGYNHVPLCTKDEGINEDFDYPYWSSAANAQQAILELNNVAQGLFPGEKFTVYVPPSNVLCKNARQWLPKVLPNLKVISSLLLEGEGQGTYIQDFEEASDGIVEFPRIVSGYYLYEYDQLGLINELGLHYVYSHFIHPDDILDPIRRNDRTWATMRSQFEDQVKWLHDNAVGIRYMTVDEAAAAVQRYSRLKVNAVLDQDTYTIRLGNFYDEASLLLRTSREPGEITGGKITKVTSSLYLIEAAQPEIKIQLRK